jgi:hypothetical protein
MRSRAACRSKCDRRGHRRRRADGGAIYEAREFGKALREIMLLADKSNQQFDAAKPWELSKNPDTAPRALQAASESLEDFRVLTVLLKPVLPALAARAEAFLGLPPQSWADLARPLPGHRINSYTHLLQRIGRNKSRRCSRGRRRGGRGTRRVRHDNRTGHDHDRRFRKIDLRIAGSSMRKRSTARTSSSLARCRRERFDRLRRHQIRVLPEDLVGRLTPMVATRRVKFGVSEGMVLAASGDGPLPARARCGRGARDAHQVKGLVLPANANPARFSAESLGPLARGRQARWAVDLPSLTYTPPALACDRRPWPRASPQSRADPSRALPAGCRRGPGRAPSRDGAFRSRTCCREACRTSVPRAHRFAVGVLPSAARGAAAAISLFSA